MQVRTPVGQPTGNNRNGYVPKIQSTLPPPPPPLRPFPDFRNPLANTLPGCYVESEEEIVPANVPQDGAIAYFPTRDLSRIYIRQWNDKGTLDYLTYIVESQQIQQPLPAPPPPSSLESQQPEQQKETPMPDFAAMLNAFAQQTANTFNQFGNVLTGMQQSIDQIADKISQISDGGVG